MPKVNCSPVRSHARKLSQKNCPLKWHGGKSYLADWIVNQMPPHLHYVEPFFGGGRVLFARDPNRNWYREDGPAHESGCSEVVNDIHGELMVFWRVLQSPALFKILCQRLAVTPVGQSEFDRSFERVNNRLWVERARRFFVRYRQSRQGLGNDFATLSRNRTRRGMNEQVSSWLNVIDHLPEVHERLRRVVILNDDALKVIRSQDGDKTLYYLDPPYLHETRTATTCYEFEYTERDHVELLRTIKQCRGKVMLSGYPSELYDRELGDWNRADYRIDNKASGAKAKVIKTECLWMNS